MAKQLNVSLAINANTAQAQAELKKLQQDLYSIMNAGSGKNLSAGMKEASAAAKELSYHLNQAYNTSTGNLDLSKLNASLQKSSTNVTQLSNKLLQAGTSGQTAFISLAKAISKADYPMFKLNGRLAEMWTTLKNTARWQLSSSVLHGFMGAVQQATSYAKELDESLNNIRIVTGMSAAEMDVFAEKANKAAKALSTTTTAYTNAALIFYQQGLGAQEVEERTAITIKMAQVAGENATEVSSYMTAIWNNFNSEVESGQRTLESFGDSLARLGADTAASSAEIAAGLEKFAAIGETVGLSFDYASAAVTTIVANTRQSADTVGTALKTIFARLQGLSLGETLEDGIDLNKYSKALEAVGVQVLDLNGEMRDANDIIYDLGMRWDGLTRAQQTALAQTVAGTRQYAQLMSLMSDFDGFLENVERSQGAEGSLQEQAEIYADAWEAARARVDAAAEGIYDSLINRDLMTGYNDLLADVLTGVENLIDGLGGLGGVISAVGTFALTLISHKIQPAIQGMVLNIRNLFESTQVQAQSLVSTFQGKVNEQISTGNYNTAQAQELRNASLLAEARARLTVASRNLNEQEKLGYQLDIENIERDAQKAQQIAEVVTKLQEEKEALLNITNVPFNSEALELYNNKLKALMTDLEVLDQLMDDAIMQDDTAGLDSAAADYEALKADIDLYIQTQEDLQSALQDSTRVLIENYGVTQENAEGYNNIANQAIQPFIGVLDSLTAEIKENADAFKDGSLAKTNYENRLRLILKSMPQMVTQSKKVKQAFGQMLKAENVDQYESALESLKLALQQTGMSAEKINKIFKQIDGQKFEETKTKVQQLKDKEEELRAVQEGLNAAVNNFNPTHMVTGLERITATAAGLGQVAMMASSLRSIFNAWSNDDMTFGEKITSTLMAISMLVPGVIGVFNSLKTVISGTAIETALYTAALKKEGLTEAEISAQRALTLALRKSENAEKITSKIVTDALTGSLKLHKIALTDEELATLKSVIASKLKDGASLKEAISSALVAATSKRVKGAINKETAAKIADKVATDALNVSIKSLLGPIGLVLALVTALISGLSIWAQKAEENAQKQRELRQEASEAAIQEAEALEEERKKNEQLYTEYINLKTRLDDSVESKEALKAKTEELCTALGVEWDALDKLQNKYEDVNREMLEARRSTLIGNIGTLQEDIAVAGEYVEDTVDKISESNDKFSEYDFGMSTGMRPGEIKQDEWWNIAEWGDGNDTYQAYETYTRPYLHGGGSTNVGIDNTEVRNLFYDWMYENYSDMLEGDPIAEDASNYGNRGHSALYFNEGTQEEDIVAVVKEFSNYLMTNGDQLGVNTDSAAYGWFKSFNGDATVKEQVAAIEGMNEELVATVKELAQVDAELAGLDVSDIKTEEEFNAYKAQWMSNFRQTMTDLGIDISTISDEALGDIAEEYLGQYENISDIIVERDVSKSISEKTGIAQDRVKEIAAEYEDFLTLVPKINFDLIDSEEELRHVLDTLQAEADANELEAKIDIVQKAQSGLKDDMSAQDYADYQTSSGIDWGNEEEGIIQYSQFLSMTYEEQVAYLQGLEDNYNSALETSIQTAIDGHTNRLNNELIPAFKAAAEVVSSFEDTMGDMGSVGDFLMGQINQLDPNADNYQDEIDRILGTQQGGVARQNFGLTSEQIDSYVRAKQEATALNEEMISVSDTVVELSNQQQVDEILDFKTAKEEAVSLFDTLSNLKIGDTISLEQFQQLSEYMPTLTEHFRQATDGTYQLKSGLDEVNNCFLLLSQIEVDGNKLFSGFEIAGMITDLEELKEAFKEGAFGLQEFNTRWAELNEVADLEGLDTEELEDYADYLQEIADSSDDLSDALDTNDEAAKIVAKSIQKMNRGIDKLADGFEDWSDVLEKSSEESEEYYEALSGMRDALSDVLDVSGDFISNDFIVDHLEDIEKAATGDADAIDRLKMALADQIVLDIVGVEKFEELPNSLQSAINEVKNIVANTDIRVGDSINLDMDDSGFIAACQKIISDANMTAEQANAYFDAMGFETQFATEEQPVEQRNPITVTKTEIQGWTSGTSTGPDGEPRDWEYPILATSTYNDGYTTETGMVDAIAMTTSTDGSTEVPKIESMTKKATGKQNNYSGSNSGGKKPGNTGGGNKGGGDKQNNDAKTKKLSDEKDRYRVIKNQLEDLTAAYENISSAKDKAFGRARLANLQKEIEAQKKLTATNKDYLTQIETYLNSDRSDLNAAIAHTGVTATFDGNKTLTNYDEILEAAVREYNQAVEEFNRHTTDDEGAKAAFEAAEERYEKVKEALDQYDETHDLWKEQQQKVLDDIMNEMALDLEETQLKVELKIEASESQLEYLEYMFDKIENKAYDCAAAFSYLNGMTEEYEKQSNAYTQGILGILENKGLGQADLDGLIKGDQGTIDKLAGMLSSGGVADLSDGLSEEEMEAAKGFTADDVDTLKEYVSGLLEANQSLMEVRQTVHDQVLEVWDEWNEKIDAGISKIEHLQSITESYQNIIDIVGQKNLGVSNEFMSKMRQQTVDQANDKLTANKAKYDSLQASFKDAKETFEAQKAKGILSPEEIKMWEDNLRQMEEDVQSAAEEFQSSWEEALEAANAAFEAAVDQIITAYDDAAAGLMGSMSELQEAFDRKSDLSSQYLEDYEKIYQISKLNREIENSIDSTDNVKAKRELLELQSKINAYEEAGVEISEYQMEQLRQEYELKKAQIELEEAQEAKSQVQMTRDADGNYSYVYTANSEDVANAEQNYEDKLHAMQQSNAEYINDLQSNMIQMEQDYQDQVQEIMKNTSLTAEERMIKLNELNQYYDEKMKFYISEAELWEENSQRLYEEDWMNYASATGYKISEEDKWLDHWDETQLSILTGFTSLEEYHSNHNMNVSNLLLSSSDAFATWQANIEEAMNNAGTSMGTFQEDATEVLDKVAEESDETKQSVVDMATDAKDAIGEVVDAVAKWEDDYSKKVQSMLAQNEALAKSFNTLLAAWSQYDDATGGDSGDGDQGGGGDGDQGGGDNNGGGKNGGGGSGKVDNSDKAAGVAAAIWMDGGSASGWGNDPGRAKKLSEKGVTGAQAYINAHGPNGDIYADWSSKRGQLKKYYYGAFDTGGYTGEWGDDSGRFAMLHQKEIVLNEEDTSNFLKTVDIVRQIAEMIDLNAMSSAGGFNSLFAATSSNLAQTLQQEVTIHAEFPNATDRDEISAAFSDLVNLASQYAHRK